MSGNGAFTGSVTAGSFNATSDYRIKEDIQTLDATYNVDALRPVIYKNRITQKQDMGVIAHELQEVYPFLVNGEKDGEMHQNVNYNGIIALVIKEIQEMKGTIKEMKEKINDLEKK